MSDYVQGPVRHHRIPCHICGPNSCYGHDEKPSLRRSDRQRGAIPDEGYEFGRDGNVRPVASCSECGRLRLAMQEALKVLGPVVSPGVYRVNARAARRILSEALEQETTK